MIIRTTRTTPLDRPFPDENTVAEMYCNEALTVDNEAVEDWTSSLQMLLTFAAIFSAVLITLILDSKALLKQDKTEVLVDAIVFLMNNLANGTHRPYDPPKFQPSTQSILVNCFFFASLCLSIATALAAVLAMQWVTDYGAVTRRAGSTPEERMKRRHLRYQGGKDWGMDAIIGALPIVLHLSVLLFYVGLIVWMWDVHHSVFAVVVVCGVVAALFYILTTILAIFYPSCPYRTPLASWMYTFLHLLVRIFIPSSWLALPELEVESDSSEGEATDARVASSPSKFMSPLLSRLAPTSLTSRDDVYIRNPDESLMASPLVWLSNQLSISPDIYRRLLLLVDGLSLVVEPQTHLSVVPWREIFRALGAIYQSIVEVPGVKEEEFTEFARRTHCLSQSDLREILASLCSGNKEVRTGSPDFPIYLLFAWSKSTASHSTDVLRRQRYSDEVVLQDLIGDISPSPKDLIETWYRLLDDEVKAAEHVLSMALGRLGSGTEEQVKRRLDTALYLVSTGHVPWESTVSFSRGHWSYAVFPSNALTRRLRAIDWVNVLSDHPQRNLILRSLGRFRNISSARVMLPQNKLTSEEKLEFELGGLRDLRRRTCAEEMLYSSLRTFDRLLDGMVDQESQQDLMDGVSMVISRDLISPGVAFDPKSIQAWQKEDLQQLSNPILLLIACATLGVQVTNQEWTEELLKVRDYLSRDGWEIVSKVCFKSSPFYDGDQTFLWWLRLRMWVHFSPAATVPFLRNIVADIELLRSVEQEIQSTRLGIDKAGDFLLALFHLNLAYAWGIESTLLTSDDVIQFSPVFFPFIPDILVRTVSSIDTWAVPKECVDYLSSICDEINADPARLIRLLIELIRADIHLNPSNRRPQILLNLLKHAEVHLAKKELRPFSPSCRRLIRYIRVSYQQFEETWDEVVNQEGRRIPRRLQHFFIDPRLHYQMVDRGELRSVYERVVTCLEPRGTWDGDEKDASWPRDFLRPTGTAVKPLEEEEEVGEGTALNGPERHDNREYGGADDQDQSPLETQPSEEHVLQDEESVVVDRATE